MANDEVTIGDLGRFTDPYEAQAARVRRRAPTREPDPLGLAMHQVDWGMLSRSLDPQIAANQIMRGEDFNPLAVLAAGAGVVGAPAAGPAEATMATLGSGLLRRGAVPIKAYHGSPHDFERFDMSKIGTGEGAQAYGHGLYFAENEGVARSYRDALSSRNIGGKMTDWSAPEDIAAGWLKIHGGDRAGAIKYLENIPNSYKTPQTKQATELLRENAQLPAVDPGRMYEVGIRAEPEQFLNWDRTVPKGAPVRGMIADEAMNRTGSAYADVRNAGKDAFLSAQSENLTGEGAYRTLSRLLGKPAATDALNAANVPGIKYLDQGSRAQAQGTSNYVLFRDDIIDILKKYGIAAPIAGELASQMAAAHPEAPQ